MTAHSFRRFPSVLAPSLLSRAVGPPLRPLPSHARSLRRLLSSSTGARLAPPSARQQLADHRRDIAERNRALSLYFVSIVIGTLGATYAAVKDTVFEAIERAVAAVSDLF